MAIELLAGERKEGETDRAVIACNDWLRFGNGRSLPKLLQKYRKSQKKSEPSTDSYTTLQKWSSSYDWQERASIYDKEMEALRNDERRKVIDEGLALDYERVRKLKKLATFLERQIYEEMQMGSESSEEFDEESIESSPYSTIMRSSAHRYGNVWLPDVKQIGSGDSATRVDLVRFNPAILEQYRGVLDDVAKEVGGRKQKTEVSGPNGGAITTVDMTIEQWKEEQAKRKRQAAVSMSDFEDES